MRRKLVDEVCEEGELGVDDVLRGEWLGRRRLDVEVDEVAVLGELEHGGGGVEGWRDEGRSRGGDEREAEARGKSGECCKARRAAECTLT